MKSYNKPELIIENIILEDIILASGESSGSWPWTSDRVGKPSDEIDIGSILG